MTLMGRFAGPPSSVFRHVLIAGLLASSVGTTCRTGHNITSQSKYYSSCMVV